EQRGGGRGGDHRNVGPAADQQQARRPYDQQSDSDRVDGLAAGLLVGGGEARADLDQRETGRHEQPDEVSWPPAGSRLAHPVTLVGGPSAAIPRAQQVRLLHWEYGGGRSSLGAPTPDALGAWRGVAWPRRRSGTEGSWRSPATSPRCREVCPRSSTVLPGALPRVCSGRPR